MSGMPMPMQMPMPMPMSMHMHMRPHSSEPVCCGGCSSSTGSVGGHRPGDAKTETYKRVVIDSRDRDMSTHPSPAKYEITLNDDLNDVQSMRLLEAAVPFSCYTVDRRNCKLVFDYVPVPGTDKKDRACVDLDPGDYHDAVDVAAVVEARMNEAAAHVVTDAFSVTYAARTDSFTITGKIPFVLRFAGMACTPARLLGFSPVEDYESNTAEAPYTIVAPFRKDISTPRYIVLSVGPSAELLQSNNNATNRSFAILTRDGHNQLIVNAHSPLVHEKRWTPPLARVARLSIELTDYDGNPYDFQNQDHHLVFIFTCVSNRKY